MQRVPTTTRAQKALRGLGVAIDEKFRVAFSLPPLACAGQATYEGGDGGADGVAMRRTCQGVSGARARALRKERGTRASVRLKKRGGEGTLSRVGSRALRVVM